METKYVMLTRKDGHLFQKDRPLFKKDGGLLIKTCRRIFFVLKSWNFTLHTLQPSAYL